MEASEEVRFHFKTVAEFKSVVEYARNISEHPDYYCERCEGCQAFNPPE